jgi:hypothetical protein
VADHGLDAEKLDVLRRWGNGLQSDRRDEVAAAGRAITLLVDEIERLHVLVWGRRLYPLEADPPKPEAEIEIARAEEHMDEGIDADVRKPLLATVRARVRRGRTLRSPQAEPQSEQDFNS